jgi:hypothetical protein
MWSTRMETKDGFIVLWSGRGLINQGVGLKQKRIKKRIVGLGSALVDILVNESDEFVRRMGVEKGGMTLVADADLEKILNSGVNQTHRCTGRIGMQYGCGRRTVGRFSPLRRQTRRRRYRTLF